jgi:hypothetical protein
MPLHTALKEQQDKNAIEYIEYRMHLKGNSFCRYMGCG